jgi:hypothetical protein
MAKSLEDNGLVSGKRGEPLRVTHRLLDGLTLGALLSLGSSLGLEDLAVVQVAAVVESLLENTLLPAEEIVAMPAETGSVFCQRGSREWQSRMLTRHPWSKRMAAKHHLARCSCH